MKRNYKILLVILIVSLGLLSFIPRTKKSDPEKDKFLLELLVYVLEKGHYSPIKFDDTLSKGVYEEFIYSLDPSKRFFLQSDIDEFSKYEYKIDNNILNKELTFFDLTHSRLIQRMEESKSYYKDILSKPFDFSTNEEINTDYEKQPYAKTKDELIEKWRKQIKLSTLSTYVDKQKLEEDKTKNKNKSIEQKLKEYKTKMGSKWTPELEKKFIENNEKVENEAPKTITQLEAESRESSLKSLNDYYNILKDLDRNDWFSVFINTIVTQFDPHTSYFAPEEKERFDVSMSGKLEGIGARLQKKNDYTEISELIYGGPAWRGKELEAGDVVLKVAQADGEPIEVIGMRLDDVVKKIKGPKGTEVRLTIKKTDGSIKIVTIIRDEIEIEETYVKSSIIEKEGNKYGLIYLPKFYIDFEDSNSRDAAKDVALEVKKLKEAGVKGIIMDVRDNGGGSLKTVVDIAGLFIDKGPIVQIKSANNKREVLYDKDETIQWDGPLVIMQNSFSASASEILAAAMQDYKRAVIIGSKQSYGKGTVQNIIDFNQFVRGSNLGDLGALKTTIQKFYRINGGSTQLEGVRSDVVMPDKYAYLKMGERDIENAMPFDKIEPAKYSTWHKQSNFDIAIANSKMRMQNNPQIKLIDEYAKWIYKKDNEYVYSLNIDKFKKELNKLEDTNKKYKTIDDYDNKLPFSAMPDELELIKKDTYFKEKKENWFESLSKDIYLEEALHISTDLQPNAKKELTSKFTNSKQIKI